jgi:hypothetical protein
MQRIIEAAQARKLDRVAAVYAVAGWILVQGASILLPTFDAPVWALRVFIIVVLVGFPVALAVAWTMAAHPHPAEGAAPAGFRRVDCLRIDSHSDRDEITRHTLRVPRLFVLIRSYARNVWRLCRLEKSGRGDFRVDDTTCAGRFPP